MKLPAKRKMAGGLLGLARNVWMLSISVCSRQ